MIDVAAGLATVTETLKLTKELRNIDHEMDKAELKLRLSDLVDGILEAKEALQDAKERERELQTQIRGLQEQLKDKSKFEDEKGRLYRLNKNGEREGEPYCNLCYVREEKLYRMLFQAGGPYNIPRYLCENHNGVINL